MTQHQTGTASSGNLDSLYIRRDRVWPYSCRFRDAHHFGQARAAKPAQPSPRAITQYCPFRASPYGHGADFAGTIVLEEASEERGTICSVLIVAQLCAKERNSAVPAATILPRRQLQQQRRPPHPRPVNPPAPFPRPHRLRLPHHRFRCPAQRLCSRRLSPLHSRRPSPQADRHSPHRPRPFRTQGSPAHRRLPPLRHNPSLPAHWSRNCSAPPTCRPSALRPASVRQPPWCFRFSLQSQ